MFTKLPKLCILVKFIISRLPGAKRPFEIRITQPCFLPRQQHDIIKQSRTDDVCSCSSRAMARLRDCSTTNVSSAPSLFTQLPHRYHQAFIHYQLHLQAFKSDTIRFQHQFRTSSARPIPSLTDTITYIQERNITTITTFHQNRPRLSTEWPR